MLIRYAERKDLRELLDIYNYEVLNGVATFAIRPRTMEEWEQWYQSHNTGRYPLMVAELDGEIAGYASLSRYREREAFDPTVELSVYVSLRHRRKGAAAALMREVIDRAAKDENTHLIISLISSENAVSKRLHERFDFTYCGTLPEVGYKMGRYLGLDQYILKV